jgi:hypothetical protein
MLMPNFRINILEAVQEMSWECFLFFASFATRLSFILFTCSSRDSGPSYDILSIADVADSISPSVVSDATLKILIFVVRSRHLVMIASAL